VILPRSTAELYYVRPIPGELRQGDIYRDVLHLMLSTAGFQVLRTRQAKGNRVEVFLHDQDHAPSDGFHWDNKEPVVAEGQLRLGIVLTHDCEIENEDNKRHRLIGLLRRLDLLSAADQETIIEGRHYGRMYLPVWEEVGMPESYLDLRRVTTLRGDSLPEDQRIASLTDLGRNVLQAAIIRYLTELYREA